MKKNAGFTLIELVAVMVILAILAVVAVPQFVDLRVQAADASAAGVGGAIASGTALNYARGVSGSTTPAPAVVVPGCDAQALAPLIGGTGSSATAMTHSGRNYTIGGTATGLGSGGTAVCTITDNNSITGVSAQQFTVVGCSTAGTC